MTEYLNRYPTMHEYAEGKRINPKLTDLISRADAIEAVAEEWLSEASAESPYVNDDDIGEYRILAEKLFEDIPSADAESDDLIIKGAKGIQDGLYNIKDGKLFKYKAKGGTVRTYPIVPSADAEPTVIRAKTFMRKEDFDKWAEDIKKQNKSIVCIPCDAEVVSADAVHGEWIHDGQNFKGGLDWCHCSECGYKTSTNGLSVYRYCPSCGARMKGGDTE